MFYNCVRCHSIGPVCADPESLLSGVVFYFWLDEGRKNQNTIISGPLAGHHQPASETPFKWGFAGVLMMSLHGMLVNVCLVALCVILRGSKKPFIFVILQGEGGGPAPPPPLDLRMTVFI